MRRPIVPLLLLAACLLLAAAASLLNSGRGALAPHIARYPITHIVIIDKENRSFDNLFGRFPGADGATTARQSDGKILPLAHSPDHTLLDIGHAGESAIFAINRGVMNRFDLLPGAIQQGR